MLFSFLAALIESYWMFLSAAVLIGLVTGWVAANDDQENSKQNI